MGIPPGRLRRMADSVFSTHVGKNGSRALSLIRNHLSMDAQYTHPDNPQAGIREAERHASALASQVDHLVRTEVHGPLLDAIDDFAKRETVSGTRLPQDVAALQREVQRREQQLEQEREKNLEAERARGERLLAELRKVTEGLR